MHPCASYQNKQSQTARTAAVCMKGDGIYVAPTLALEELAACPLSVPLEPPADEAVPFPVRLPDSAVVPSEFQTV